MIKAMFVNDDGCVPYASAIVGGYKNIETRNRNVLWQLEGERVAVVRTRRGKKPTVIGFVDVVGKQFYSVDKFHECFSQHLVPPGSKYDAVGKGKWVYYLANPEAVEPFLLPADAIRHGRSWCEFEMEEYRNE